MFNNNKKNKGSNVNTNSSGKGLPSVNMISEGTTLNGNLTTKNDIRIAGKLEGEAKANGKLIVSSTGSVDGDVESSEADIAGELKGEIHVSKKLILRKSAVINGDIYTKSLLVEEGATINGACHMGNQLGSDTSSNSEPKNSVSQNKSSKTKASAVKSSDKDKSDQ